MCVFGEEIWKFVWEGDLLGTYAMDGVGGCGLLGGSLSTYIRSSTVVYLMRNIFMFCLQRCRKVDPKGSDEEPNDTISGTTN